MNARPPGPQRGAFTIQFAVVLTALLSMVGLALDVSRVYARQAEMHGFAQSAALAAAHVLDGTPAGIDASVQRALAILNGAGGPGADTSIRQNGALQFGATPDGPWSTPDAAALLAAEQLELIRFARVDTEPLGGAVTEVERFFAPEGTTSITFRETAVAGQTLLPILPLAVCAKNENSVLAEPVPALGSDIYELVEYGFRRGVAYNLLGLDAKGGVAGNFVVDPVEFPEDGGSPNDDNFEPDVVRPFVCSGSIMHPSSNKLYVKPNFPLELIPELNSRFKLPSSCHASVGLPDKNIMEYLDASWLNNTPTVPYAKEVSPRTLDTYGTIWAYARPVQYSPNAPGNAGLPFSRTAVPKLYPVDTGEELKLPSWSDSLPRPYIYRGFGTSTTPTGTSVLFRRIVNIPLLQCPVSGNVATVLAFGKFLLTSRAVGGTTPYIAGEFGGVLTGARPLMTRLYR